jgi:putative copper export protein
MGALGRGGAEVVRKPWFVVSAAAVGLALLRTLGLVAHATEGDLGAVGGIADLVHLVGVAAWVGGLVLLATVVLPRRRVDELRRVIPAYSRLAFVAIIAIVVAGTVMAWDLAGSFGALRTTEWGRLLLLKIALFAVVLVAAQLSKRWVLDRLGLALALRGHLVLVRPFVVSVAAETLLAAAVLGVASALVTTSPGR